MPLSNTEGRLLLALNAYNNGQFSSLLAAADTYDVNYHTLRKRLLGISSRRDVRPNSCKLTSIEEEVVLQRILDLDAQGYPPRLRYVREMANIVLASRGDASPQTVGKNWPDNFVKRQETLCMKYRRRKDYQRDKCEDPAIIKTSYET
jgi:hypothetical protein